MCYHWSFNRSLSCSQEIYFSPNIPAEFMPWSSGVCAESQRNSWGKPHSIGRQRWKIPPCTTVLVSWYLQRLLVRPKISCWEFEINQAISQKVILKPSGGGYNMVYIYREREKCRCSVNVVSISLLSGSLVFLQSCGKLMFTYGDKIDRSGRQQINASSIATHSSVYKSIISLLAVKSRVYNMFTKLKTHMEKTWSAGLHIYIHRNFRFSIYILSELEQFSQK